jgi:circadian clock protein KaiB
MSTGKWGDGFASGDGTGIVSSEPVQLAAGPAGDLGWQASEVVPDRWRLRLYVSGDSPKSIAAFANLKRLCESHLADRYEIEIVDLLEHPLMAHDEEIVAIPTLERRAPRPVRRIIGDLSNTDEVLAGLQIRPKQS